MPSLWKGWLLPASASSYGPHIDQLYTLILWITAAIFVGVELCLAAFSVRYREKPGQTPSTVASHRGAEMVWTSIPVLLLVSLALVSQNLWSQLRAGDRFPANALVVRVTGEQWLWHFQFPDGLTVENTVHLPLNQPVRFDI